LHSVFIKKKNVLCLHDSDGIIYNLQRHDLRLITRLKRINSVFVSLKT